MATALRIKARITPWDDPAFVKAFEHAWEAVEPSGIPDGAAGPAVERRLREAGYPDATVTVWRSVDEALERRAHWQVRRDG